VVELNLLLGGTALPNLHREGSALPSTAALLPPTLCGLVDPKSKQDFQAVGGARGNCGAA